jgi:squalene-hopene/tetraprenyl-beta-curcumene cyclase
LRAIFAVQGEGFGESRSCGKATRFLARNQQADGSWLPLWGGNQDRPDESNPIYGTSRVLATAGWGAISPEAIRRGCDFLIANQNSDGGWGGGPSVAPWIEQTCGGADGPPLTSSVEETALAVDGLVTVLLAEQSGSARNSARNSGGHDGVELGCSEAENSRETAMSGSPGPAAGNEPYRVAIIRSVEFLLGSVEQGRHRVPWPIGFYFAKLWYHERLYPLIFATIALAKYSRWATHRSNPN